MFEISQSALIVENNQLLILQIPNKKWVFVWWKINKNESYIEALQREVNEEIWKRKIYIEKIIGVDNWIYNWIPKYWVFFKELLWKNEYCMWAWMFIRWEYFNQNTLPDFNDDIALWYKLFLKNI